MSMISVCKMNRTPYHHRMSNFYRRIDSLSSSSSSISSNTSSLDHLFSRLLDALIFTSAIAITAYSYLTGNLLVNSVSTDTNNDDVIQTNEDHPYKQKSFSQECMEDDRRKRTQAWAEQQTILPLMKQRAHSVSTARDHHLKRKKRAHSLPVNKIPKEEQDEVLLRMEERLKSMIQEGQEALSSPVNY